jgi:hypothetical protein
MNGRSPYPLSCAICATRKEKRFCPAVHGRICPQCCGSEREVTVDCAIDCPYLAQAREHERPRELSEVDQAALFPEVSIPERYLYEHDQLLGAISYTLAKAARADRLLNDRDLIGALSSLAKTLQRLAASGLVYEEPTQSGAQQVVVNELRALIGQFREMETKHLGRTTLHDVDLVAALVFVLRIALTRTSGRPRSRAFIAFLLEQFPKDKSLIAAADKGPSRLIVP